MASTSAGSLCRNNAQAALVVPGAILSREIATTELGRGRAGSSRAPADGPIAEALSCRARAVGRPADGSRAESAGRYLLAIPTSDSAIPEL